MVHYSENCKVKVVFKSIVLVNNSQLYSIYSRVNNILKTVLLIKTNRFYSVFIKKYENIRVLLGT